MTQLRSIAGNKSDPRSKDAALVLSEVTGNVCTETGQTPAPDVTPVDEDDIPVASVPASHDWGWFGNLPVHPGEEIVSTRLKSLISEIDRETKKSNVYRYLLPVVYQDFLLRELHCVGSASRAAASAALDKHLPYLWMTRPMFEEIHAALAMNDRKPYVEEYRAAQERAAQLLPKWRRVKELWEGVHGPTQENICDLLYSGDDFIPVPQIKEF
jgi:hypothetical protein